MRIKNKKAMEGGTWWIIMGAIVAIIVAGIIIFIVKDGLFQGKKGVEFLNSCGGQGGTCETKEDCDKKAGSSRIYKFSECAKGSLDYCCIPKQT